MRAQNPNVMMKGRHYFDGVFARAIEICRIMDLGFWHGPKKSETV